MVSNSKYTIGLDVESDMKDSNKLVTILDSIEIKKLETGSNCKETKGTEVESVSKFFFI